MKTFKLVSMYIMKEQELLEIPLEDGLIINKEDEHQTWLIEAYTSKQYQDYFQESIHNKQELLVQVIITKKDNDPAPLKGKAISISIFDEHMSVLLEGTLSRTRRDYAEHLLSHLLEEGYSGEQLLEEFKINMQSKHRLASMKDK